MPEFFFREKSRYIDNVIVPLFLEIERRNPYDEGIWRKAIRVAEEEDYDKTVFFGIPAAEIIEIGEKIRKAKTLKEKYEILTNKCSKGKFWFDIIFNRGENLKALKALKNAISWRKWRRGLDVGCGIGNSTMIIAPYCQEIYGVDLLEFLVKIGADRPELSRSQLLVGDARRLPFRKESFDLVYSNGLFGYLDQRGLIEFYKEVIRVLEPGGFYFEAFWSWMKEEIPRSGKELLVYLISEMISFRKEKVSLETAIKESFVKEGKVAIKEIPFMLPMGTMDTRLVLIFQKEKGS
ncbi:MAG: class I SAM-dependent methyltransferase [Candidatus Methanospirareceae archaeon]